ncbi:MAG: transketolase [Geminicoccaceae bacterium]
MTVSQADLANAIRALAMDAVEQAKSGHPGMPMGMADVATVLWTRFLKFDPQHPEWPDRDRFVLSAGHGSMLLYALLHLTGYPDMTLDELRRFRQLGARTAGHPEHGHAFGIETTTGPLGQGLANAVGMALAERHLAARFGDDLVDHHTYVIAGDGCLMEGISHEAASLAGHLGLGRLIVLFDDNGISIDGPTSLSVSDDQVARFTAYGWHTAAVDGHDPAAVERAIEAARAETGRPSLIACKTVIGKGAPTKAGKNSAHGAPLGAAEIEGARAALHWPYPPFVIPDELLKAWRAAGERGAASFAAWTSRHDASARGDEFDHSIAGKLPGDLTEKINAHKRKLSAERPAPATRKASQMALEVLTAAVPEMVGGSADLTGSNLTNTAATKPLAKSDYGGRYVSWGVREHAMVAGMNGMAVHGGVIPYGGTFLVFADYCRPALRLAALMQQRVIFVATHDSIGLGEDGPTHQPVEQLASLRAIPNMLVFRPADAVETMECWELALRSAEGPSTLALTRQELPTLRTEHTDENLCARGAYLLRRPARRDVTILATGSEVHIALAAADQLAATGIEAAVASMPSWELFERQDPSYRAAVLGTAPRVAVEAASPFGWTRYVASEADVVCMRGFGASGPFKQLYQHFGITPEHVAERARAVLGAGPHGEEHST